MSRWIAFFLVSAGIAFCPVNARPADDPNEPLPVIDAHLHTNFTGEREATSRIPQSKEQMLKEMKENNVVGAVSHTGEIGGEYYEDLKKHNVVFCFGIGDSIDPKAVEEGLKSGKYNGIKIYLGYYHRWAYDPVYGPLYQLAEKYDVPVVFHTGDTYGSKAKVKYSDPLTIDEVAVDHPKVRFVIAHCGNPWIISAAEVVYKNPNVYTDLSGIMIGDLSQFPAEDLDTYLIKPIRWMYRYVGNPRKFLYGSDWPLVPMGQYIRVIRKAIPREDWKAVFHDNAVELFRMKMAEP